MTCKLCAPYDFDHCDKCAPELYAELYAMQARPPQPRGSFPAVAFDTCATMAEAIALSIAENRPVVLRDRKRLLDEILAEADGTVNFRGQDERTYHFFGSTSSGEIWRVHITAQ